MAMPDLNPLPWGATKTEQEMRRLEIQQRFMAPRSTMIGVDVAGPKSYTAFVYGHFCIDVAAGLCQPHRSRKHVDSRVVEPKLLAAERSDDEPTNIG